MFLFSTIRIIPGRAVPSFLSGRYSAVKVRKKLYVTIMDRIVHGAAWVGMGEMNMRRKLDGDSG